MEQFKGKPRLPKFASPKRYDIRLKPDLTNCKFAGSVAIDLNIVSKTKFIVLNATDLSIQKETVSFTRKASSFYSRLVFEPCKVDLVEEDVILVLEFPETLPIGIGVLAVEFDGILNDKMKGFYRSTYEHNGEKKNMAVTQFEPVDARRCFPCWDEPACKATFKITLDVPSDLVALSNMPIVDEKFRPANGGQSMTDGNRMEALKVLVDCVGRNDGFVGCTDRDGNTILHLAVARKQLEIIKYLLSSTNIEVDAQNAKGFTALDVLSHGPRDLRDMEIKQLLQKSGASIIYQTSLGGDTIEAIPIAQPYIKQNSDIKPPVKTRKHTDWLGRKRSALIVVASLIATVAFQATLSPPGGFWQDDFTADPAKNDIEKSHHVGMAVMATALPQAYGQFMIFNTLAFLSSLSIILLVVSGLPMKRRRWMWTQMVTMRIAITALTITYFIAWIHMTPQDNRGVLNTGTQSFCVSVVMLDGARLLR
ncbi:hypothetical protein NL676_033550 [Syzygium grande]|nr:hypothetical protein NL676_033550 [Syzygium grande]